MTCKACQNTMKRKKLDVPFLQGKQFAVVSGAAGWECPVCGERVFDERATEKILDALLEGHPKKFLKTAVYPV